MSVEQPILEVLYLQEFRQTPPPVAMKFVSARPRLIAAAAESPPPIIDLTPGCFTIASITPIVPAWKSGFQNTPIGPFHTTVFAPDQFLVNLTIDLGPISNQGILGQLLHLQCLSLQCSQQMRSLLLSQLAINLPFDFQEELSPHPILSSSTSELPISIPCAL